MSSIPIAQTTLDRGRIQAVTIPARSAGHAITAEGLVKTYKSSGTEQVRALDGLDLTVEEGSVLGLLGPNGAGKTTTVRILATLLKPDKGRATIAGYDVVRDAQRLRSLIGLSGQYASVDENLTGRENLYLFGRLYQLSKSEARRRGDELLEQLLLPMPPTVSSRPIQAGCAAASIWPAPSPAGRSSSSSMSRRPDSIRAAGSACGRRFASGCARERRFF